MKLGVIIPAAGQGVRIGGKVPKQFLNLNGKPLLQYTLEGFAQCDLVDSIILAVPEADLEDTRKKWLNQPDIVKQIIAGGEKRQDSVFNGFQALDKDTDIVMVHDGARPFVTVKMIQETATAAKEFGAAITAIPVSDTIKQDDGSGFVSRTLDREHLWRVQTPQAFQYDLIREAFDKARKDSFYGTDEGSLVERLGKKVKIVLGSELNIKITQPEDLLLGEQIAARHNPL